MPIGIPSTTISIYTVSVSEDSYGYPSDTDTLSASNVPASITPITKKVRTPEATHQASCGGDRANVGDKFIDSRGNKYVVIQKTVSCLSHGASSSYVLKQLV